MGMAASQARYLALQARKTNAEYEGQQINQARTALANQSANLFNRLLGMEVPNPPKTTDYTKVQYSYTDGNDASVIDEWKQLSSADPNYNYIVKRYYNTNVFTGFQKMLTNPEVQTKEDTIQTPYSEIAKEDAKKFEKPIIKLKFTDGENGTVTILIGEGSNEQKIENIPDMALATYKSLAGVPSDKNLENAKKGVEDKFGIKITDKDYGYQDANGTWHFVLQKELYDLKPDGSNLFDYTNTYNPSAIGNMKLEELTRDASGLSKEDNATLSQIIKDAPKDANIHNYLRFDPTKGLVYGGSGIYKFEMNGQTYYTCEADLYNSMQTQDEFGKPIEAQAKLPYYGASYIQKKVEEPKRALLETDGSGRFKTVRFEDDSLVYNLNTETVTDEAAYQDAMNQYLYKKEQYEKTIADINAKTSIIHQEDRTLELRLKQLDTEHLALQTEMEAVNSVIKKNVEKTFKTFGD